MPHLRRVATTRVQRLQQSLLSSILLLLVTPSPCACADVSCVETTSRCSGPWRWFHRKIRFIVSFSPFPADWAQKKIKKRRKTGAGQQATKKNRKKGWRQIASNEIPLFFFDFLLLEEDGATESGRNRNGKPGGYRSLSVKNIRYDDFVYVYECVHVTKKIGNFSTSANNGWQFHTPRNSQKWWVLSWKGPPEYLCKANSHLLVSKSVNRFLRIRTLYKNRIQTNDGRTFPDASNSWTAFAYGSFRGGK